MDQLIALYYCIGYDPVCRPFGVLICMMTIVPFLLGIVLIGIGIIKGEKI